jgi:Concanavalin A-like lectin/glucanases superfamily/GLEYA domain
MSFSLLNGYSSVIPSNVLGYGNPNAPTGLTYVSATTTTITISFTVPVNSGVINSYTPSVTPSIAVTGSGTSSSYTISGLASGTTYNIYLTATNNYGTSAVSTSYATGTTVSAITYTFYLDTKYMLNNYYTFETSAISGTSLKNMATNSYDATLYNGATNITTAGNYKAGSAALTLAGGAAGTSSQYVGINYIATTSTNGFSIAFWFKSPTVYTWARFFDFGFGSENYNILCTYAGGGTNMLSNIRTAAPGTSIDNYNYDSTAVNDNAWRHYVWTFSPTGLWTFYLNGSVYKTVQNVSVPTTIRTSNFLGKSNWAADAYMQMIMDEFRFYNKSISANDVLNLYNYTGSTTGKYYPISATWTPKYDYLVAYYPFDEASGASTAVDQISGYNATSVNTVTFGGTGKVSKCVTFNGSNNYLSIPYNVLNNLTMGSVACWVYPTSLTNSVICGKQVDGVNTYGVLSIGCYSSTGGGITTGTSGIVYWHSQNSQAIAASASNNALSANVWSHIVVTFTSTTVMIYINGVLDSSTSTNGSIPPYTTPTYTRIGNWGSGYFAGSIDEFAVWNTPLTGNDVLYIYNNQNTASPSESLPGALTNAYARYRASDYNSSTNTWADSTGNGRNIPSGQITSTGLSLVTSSGNGSSYTFPALQGTTSSKIQFTTADITNYTLFHVARYTGGTRRRIFANLTTQNYLNGFWNGLSGIAHYNSWVTQSSTDTYGNNWLISSSTGTRYRSNGIERTIAAGSLSSLPPLYINDISSETSDFQVADVIIFNSVLTTLQIQRVENYLFDLYGLGPEQPDILSTAYARYHATGYNASSGWSDGTGNSRTVPTSQITSTGFSFTTTSVSNGSSKSFTALQGTTSSRVQFTTSTLTSYTLFNVCRYTTTNRNRLMTSTSADNMLFGHHGSKAGCSYHNGWLTDTSVDLVGNNWLLSTDSQYLYRANGINMTTLGSTVGSTYLPAFGLNQTSELSDFFYADCIIFNSVLTTEQIIDMENYLTQLYGLKQDGVVFKIYSNYHSESPTYDSTASIRSSSNCVGLITNMTNVSTGTNALQAVNGADNYSVFWSGYLLSDFTGTWTFGLAADDGAYLWIGDYAQSGYTVANCNINNGGGHGVTNVTCTVNLIYGKYYPIRYFFGEMGGGDDCQLYFSRNGSANNYSFSGYFYQQIYTNGYGYKIETVILAAPTVAPSGFSATATGSSITLSFSTVSRATSYYASTSPGGFNATSTGSPITISGLSPSTSYTITIYGLNSGGNGPSATYTYSTTAAVAVTVSATGTYTSSTYGSYTVYTWTGSGTVTFSGAKSAYFFMVGGGGSGGGSCLSGNSSPGGGSGGGVYYNSTTPVAFTGGTSYAITVGGGGGAAGNGVSGSVGGTTSIVGTGVSISTTGGNGGSAPTGDSSGAAGGGAVSSGSGGGTGAVIATSGAGGSGARSAGGGGGSAGPNPNITAIGFSSIVSSGGGGGVGGPYNAPGSPGTASGGGSGTSVIDSNAVAATWYGCGGGGALGDGRNGFGRPGYVSGAGAPGVVYIWF